MVYNPHRVNVGSLGLVPKELSGGYVSGIYIVFRVKKVINAEYILHILKSPYYLGVIGKYDTKYGAVRADLTYGQLCNIRIPLLNQKETKEFLIKIDELNLARENCVKIENNVKNSLQQFLP